MVKPDYWFKRRRYGWGWIPVTWQGWMVIATYILVVFSSAILLLGDVPRNTYEAAVGYFFAIFIVTTIVLLAVTRLKGPKPKWRWGKSPDDDPDLDW